MAITTSTIKNWGHRARAYITLPTFLVLKFYVRQNNQPGYVFLAQRLDIAIKFAIS